MRTEVARELGMEGGAGGPIRPSSSGTTGGPAVDPSARDGAGADALSVGSIGREWIAGVPVDRVDMGGAMAVVRRVLRDGSGDRCRILVVNANKAWLARRDPRLREVLTDAELVIAEWAMVWAAERLGLTGIGHVGGITLMQELLVEAEREGWSVYLLGARPEVVDALADRLRTERPGLRLAGWHHGYLDGTLSERVRHEIAEERPDLLFVAMGSPLQEFWIDEGWAELGARVALGVGGSFDVLAGLKRDAPAWARGRGLEWVYRLVQDPRRLWRRYLITNSWFVGRVWRERIRDWATRADAGKGP